MKNKIILICLSILIVSISASAQKTFNLEDYVISNAGDEWQYKNLIPDGPTPVVFGISKQLDFKGTSVVQRSEGNGDHRLQTLDNKGLKIYQLYFEGDMIIEYNKPVLLMPAKLKSGEVYRSKADYKYLVNSEVKENGTQTYQVKFVGTQDVTIGEKTFEGCLLLTTKSQRKDSSGATSGYLLREWYAKGIGVIKVLGTFNWNDPNGKPVKTSYLSAEIENAIIDGKEIDLSR